MSFSNEELYDALDDLHAAIGKDEPARGASNNVIVKKMRRAAAELSGTEYSGPARSAEGVGLKQSTVDILLSEGIELPDGWAEMCGKGEKKGKNKSKASVPYPETENAPPPSQEDAPKKGKTIKVKTPPDKAAYANRAKTHPGVIRTLLLKLTEGPICVRDAADYLIEQFPDRPKKGLEHTAYVQLCSPKYGLIAKGYDVSIKGGGKGGFDAVVTLKAPATVRKALEAAGSAVPKIREEQPTPTKTVPKKVVKTKVPKDKVVKTKVPKDKAPTSKVAKGKVAKA